MSTQLSPVVAQKLAAFSVRWRRLVLLRGAAEGVVTFLGGMTVVALVDRVVILPEGVRYTLSLAAYASTGAVVWFGCLRHLRRVPNEKQIARLVEKLRPDLREDLISAVELADAETANWDSPVFRKLLQEDITRRMDEVEVESLLPQKLISRWLVASVAVVVVCGFLALAPGLGYTRLMARALAPMANIERVSSVSIKLLEPANGDAPVPRGDPVQFVVDLGGPEVDRAYLETVQPDGRHERVAMNAAGGRRFTASANIAGESLEYRIRAGDALTRFYTLHSAARPHVNKFAKTYNFPAYAQKQPQRVTEESGDLSALEGSTAQVKITANQRIKEGVLQVEQAGRNVDIPLVRESDTEWSASVPLTAAGTYKVKLVSADTGFENKFSPQYEIRPLADLLPSVNIDQPARDQILPPDEVIEFSGSAKDDLALTQVNQMVRVNEGQWQTIPLLNGRTNDAKISRRWDLLGLKLVAGDRVVTKLAAIDVKGNRAESVPLTLQISSPGLDPKRLKAMEAQRLLQRSLVALEKVSDNLKQVAGKDLKKDDELSRQQAMNATRSAMEEVERNLGQVEQRLKEALPQAAAGREAADLSLVGLALSVLHNEHLAQAKTAFDAMMAKLSDTQKLDVRKVAEPVSHAYGIADRTAKAFNDILSSSEAGLTAATLQYLDSEQGRVIKPANDNPNDNANIERLSRREEGATRETQLVENLMQAMADHMPHQYQGRTSKMKEAVQKSRASMEKSLAEKKGHEILSASRDYQKGINNTWKQFASLEQELARNAVKAREYLEQFDKNSLEKLDHLRKTAEQLADAEKKLNEAKAKNRKTEKEEAKVAENRTKLDQEWKAATEQLKDRAKWEELRKDGDSQFVQDTTKTAQALTAMRAAANAEEQSSHTAENLKQLQQAYQKLDAAHTLTDLSQSAKQLANQERYEANDLEASTRRPMDWQRLQHMMQTAPKELADAQLAETSRKALAQATSAPQNQEIQREMSQRQSPDRKATPVDSELERLATNLKQAEDAAQPEVNAARQQIAQAAPKLSEMMAGLAKAAERLQATTKNTAEKADPNSNEMREAARAELNEQQDLTQQVKELQEAIRRDANTQDLTAKDGRDRSRDADDAIAMLREPPPKAEAALRDATMARDPEGQKQSMQNAAQQQQQLSKALQQLAQHYENAEAGKAELSRAELRKNEENLGIKGALDSQYDKAEQLAQMMQKSPQELIKELEKELAHNEIMRKELDNIADQSLDKAKANLQHATDTETQLAKSLADVAKANEQKNSLGEQMKQLKEKASQLAEHDVPTIRMEAASAKANASEELEQTAKSLKDAISSAPTDLNVITPQAAERAEMVAKPLQDAANNLRATANKADAALKKAPATDPRAASAQSAKSKAEAAANKAQQLANDARKLADTLKTLASSNSGEVQRAAETQKPLASDVTMAGADIARAGRHEARLGTPQGDALQKVGKETQNIGEKSLPTTAEQVAKANTASEAKPPIDSAKGSMEKQMAELKNALANAAAPAPANAAPEAHDLNSMLQQLSPEESQWKARTLDRLDQAMNAPQSSQDASQQGQQGQSQQGQSGQQQQQQQQQQNGKSQSGQAGQSAQQAAQQALSEAAKAQQRSMAQARNSNQTPGLQKNSETPGDGLTGAFKAGQNPEEGEIPEVDITWTGEWGKLPPKMAQGLLEARRENMSGEYREMVETYFKVLADRAREKK